MLSQQESSANYSELQGGEPQFWLLLALYTKIGWEWNIPKRAVIQDFPWQEFEHPDLFWSLSSCMKPLMSISQTEKNMAPCCKARAHGMSMSIGSYDTMGPFGENCMSYSQYHEWQGHVKGGHRILYGQDITGPTRVLMQDPCPEILTVAHILQMHTKIM